MKKKRKPSGSDGRTDAIPFYERVQTLQRLHSTGGEDNIRKLFFFLQHVGLQREFYLSCHVPEWSGAAALLPEIGLELHVTKRDAHNTIQGYLLFSVPTPLTAAWKSLIQPAVASVRTAGAAPGPSSDPIFFSVPSATAPGIDFPLKATYSRVFLSHDI